jgi:hypothetical protein
MAQEVLCKKLEGDTDQLQNSKARDRLTNMFDAPLPADSMAAIEELLKFISLDGKRAAVPLKVLLRPQRPDAMSQ